MSALAASAEAGDGLTEIRRAVVVAHIDAHCRARLRPSLYTVTALLFHRTAHSTSYVTTGRIFLPGAIRGITGDLSDCVTILVVVLLRYAAGGCT